jgi:hypothetical protein
VKVLPHLKRHHAALLALAVLAAPSGCGSYKRAPPLTTYPMAADSPSAVVRNTPGIAFSTYLVSVDGREVPYDPSPLGGGIAHRVRVPAGPHVVQVNVDGQNIVFRWVFAYDFLDGHEYRLDHAGAFDQHVRVKDETAGTSRVMREGEKQ